MVDSFISYLTYERRYSEHTIQAYRKDLDLFMHYLNDHADGIAIDQANYQDIRGWIYRQVKSGSDANTINRRISCLRSFYNFLFRQGIISENPTARIENLKTKKRLPEVLTEKEIARLFAQFEKDGGVKDFEDLRNYLMLQLFYATGMRRHELVNLKLSDFDLTESKVKVLGKGNKERQIPIIDAVVSVLKPYLVKRSEVIGSESTAYLFIDDNAKPLSSSKVYHIIRSMLGQITTRSKRSPHVLRHSFATHLLNAGADIQVIKELLGHSSLAATQVYTHNSIEKLKQAYKLAHPKS